VTSRVLSAQAARYWHGATAAVVAFGFVVQLGLVISGASVLTPDDPPSLADRLVHFFAYFTIQSNILVFIGTLVLARRPNVDGPVWRVIRLDGLLGITVTGVIHWFFLRPLLHLEGWSYATDKILHVVVPLMAVIGWVAFGPRFRITSRSILAATIWPILYMLGVTIYGAATDWYAYPFIDVTVHGYPTVIVTGVVILAFLLALAAIAAVVDRRLPTGRFDAVNHVGTPRSPRPGLRRDRVADVLGVETAARRGGRRTCGRARRSRLSRRAAVRPVRPAGDHRADHRAGRARLAVLRVLHCQRVQSCVDHVGVGRTGSAVEHPRNAVGADPPQRVPVVVVPVDQEAHPRLGGDVGQPLQVHCRLRFGVDGEHDLIVTDEGERDRDQVR